MTTTWNGTTDDWRNAAAWSTGLVPTPADTVVLPAAPPYTLTIAPGEADTAATVTITPGATLHLAGTLAATILGYTFPPSQISGDDSSYLYAPPTSADGGTIDDAGGTILGGLDVGNGFLNVAGGPLTLRTASGAPAPVSIAGGLLTFLNDQTFDNAHIALNGGTLAAGDPTSTVSLTLGPQIQLTASGGTIGGHAVINQGTIVGSFNANLQSFTNAGLIVGSLGPVLDFSTVNAFTNAATGLLIASTGTTVYLGSRPLPGFAPQTISNLGTIVIEPGATLAYAGTEDLTGADPLATFGKIANAGGTLLLGGTLLNTCATLRQSALAAAFGTTTLAGTLQSGTFVADAPVTFTNAAILDGVTWQGTLALDGATPSDATLTALGNLAFRGLDGTGTGTLTLTNNALLSLGPSVDGTAPSLSNVAITMRGGQIEQSFTLATDSTLTAATPFAADSLGSVNNEGTITPAAFGGQLTAASLVNDGTLTVTDSDTLKLDGGIDGAGTIGLANGGTIELVHGDTGLTSADARNIITFEDASLAKLVIDSPAYLGTVAGFRPGNVIDLANDTGTPLDPTHATASIDTNTITVSNNGSYYGYVSFTPGTDLSAGVTLGTDGHGGLNLQLNPAAPIRMTDTSTGATYTAAATAYTGPAAGLTSAYAYTGPDNVALRATTPSVFLSAGPGANALAATSGNNVLASGPGSAFLSGGTGHDTFFVDGRGTQPSWDTIANFHAGDSVTLWGFVPGASQYTWSANQGAPGYTGATLHATLPGTTASITFAGLANPQSLTLTPGTAGNTPYLSIAA